MQKSKCALKEYVLLPVPAELLEELELSPFDAIQFSISKGRLIIEPVDADYDMVCIGNCCRCPGRHECEAAWR